jgi:hypothetical protein
MSSPVLSYWLPRPPPYCFFALRRISTLPDGCNRQKSGTQSSLYLEWPRPLLLFWTQSSPACRTRRRFAADPSCARFSRGFRHYYVTIEWRLSYQPSVAVHTKVPDSTILR